MAAVWKLAFLLSCLVLSGPAVGQCRLCGQPSTSAVPVDSQAGDVQLQIETNLNFDRMILSGGGNGGATIRPDGSNGVEGSVMQLGPRATVGTVLVHGDPNRAVRVQMPRRVQLFSLSGGQITVDDLSADVPTVTRLDAAGNLSFRFGGRIILTGDADGSYRGDLPITVEYQ
ncbi:MAG TPA: DUF4402 domain-containing protein [Sphingomicrobium sp.]